MIKNLMASLASVALAVGIAGSAVAADANTAKSSWLKVGTLTCAVDPNVGWVLGSSKEAECYYKGFNGEETAYSAQIMRIGVDLSYTKSQTLVWAVLAPGNRKPESLNGSYVGVSAEATVIAGVAANAMLGGFKDSVALQPLSVGMQTGIGAAAGISTMTLSAN